MTTRLGLVGRGKWGRNIERTLLSFADVSVVAIGRDEPPPSGLEGVLIATPSATHARVALPYIDAGIATFIEKPMATSVVDAELIEAAARRANAPVFVGHIHLYNQAFSALRDTLPSLGAVRYVHCEGAKGNPRADSSVLWDWLPHDLSMANAIFGADPSHVQAWSLTNSPMPQAAVTRYQFGSTSVVSAMSWLTPVRLQSMTICAERATLVFDDKAERKLVLHGEGGAVSYPEYAAELPLTRELRSFLKIVRGGAADRSHVALGVAIARAIAAAEESIARGGELIGIRP